MHRTRKNLRSTRIINPPTDILHPTQDMCPPKETNAACEMFCFAALADANEHTLYTDLAGKFPVRSFSGQQYIFVAYVYNANATLVRPMKNREAASFINAFKDIYSYLKQRNYTPKLHVLDNEVSKEIVRYI